MSIRKKHSAEFKARVALEAIQGFDSVNSIAVKYGINAVMVSRWKTEALGSLVSGFKDKRSSVAESNLEKQYQDSLKIIGQLKVENDFLVNASRQLGLMGGRK